MSVIIMNRSDWPAPALKAIAVWVARREGLGNAQPYSFFSQPHAAEANTEEPRTATNRLLRCTGVFSREKGDGR